MTVGIDVFIKMEVPWQVCKRFPKMVFKCPGESCAMFFLGKTPMWFLIMVIPQESYTGSFKGSKVRTIMSSKHPLLPEFIKTLNGGISTRFSLWDKYQMDTHKQVKSNDMGEAVGITSSSSGSHFIIHLGYNGNTDKSPCLNQMPAQRYSLLVGKLSCGSSMPCHIHRMKGIKAGNTFRTSEISRPNNVCLMEVTHFLCLKVRIRLIIAISFGLNFTSLTVTREDPGDSRNGWNFTNLSLFKLPMDNLCTNSRESRTTSPVRLQFFSNGENLFNQMLRGFSPNSFGARLLSLRPSMPCSLYL